jgi:hypothetical protein
MKNILRVWFSPFSLTRRHSLLVLLCVFYLVAPGALGLAQAADHVTQYGITWKFDKDYPSGQFVNGDYWVIGPVTVVAITNDLHTTPGFTPEPGDDGSMVNPGTDGWQGYCRALANYKAELNAGLPNGKPVAADNPLVLPPASSLVSMVSWLFKSPEDKEPGSPRYDTGTHATRSATRSGAVLTVLASAPPEGSFRPPYCGADKTVKYNVSKMDISKLKNLAPVADTPNAEEVIQEITRPWIDHVNEWLGAGVHPTENMPNYGREIALELNDAALLLQLDFSKLPGSPSKEKLAIPFVQLGIDLTGIADNGGYWPANGGHEVGRKWPIMLTGILLDDAHMKDVGHWNTRFQEDEQTFFVSQKEVNITNGPDWKPDKRAKMLTPYTKDDIGLPEWGIVHTVQPQADNKELSSPYRSINGPIYPGIVLSARIMGMEEAWNHPALFAYAERWMKMTDGKAGPGAEAMAPFAINMWKAYGKEFKTKDAKESK